MFVLPLFEIACGIGKTGAGHLAISGPPATVGGSV